jgi:fructosamine-3-kinase
MNWNLSPPENMASAKNIGDIHALLDLLTQQFTNMNQQFADLGQQITDLQRQQQPAPSGTPAPTTITSSPTGTSNVTSWRSADIGSDFGPMSRQVDFGPQQVVIAT